MHEFRRLAEGVHAFLQPPLICFGSAGVIIGNRDVIVVDSLTNTKSTELLLNEIRRVTDKPIRFLINTHSHVDHVYTNHLFPDATVITSHAARESTIANRDGQARCDEYFAEFFPNVDFTGGRFTPQDLDFTGTLTLHQSGREIRLIELGAGHSESDVVVHLPAERVVFCGDVFVNGLPPLPAEGHVSTAIENYRAIEALDAAVYVAGHGAPGTLADVQRQRLELEDLFGRARLWFDRGLPYDAALQAAAESGGALDFQRLTILAAYWEFAGTRPDTTDRASRNHLALLQAIAEEARRRWRGNQRERGEP